MTLAQFDDLVAAYIPCVKMFQTSTTGSRLHTRGHGPFHGLSKYSLYQTTQASWPVDKSNIFWMWPVTVTRDCGRDSNVTKYPVRAPAAVTTSEAYRSIPQRGQHYRKPSTWLDRGWICRPGAPAKTKQPVISTHMCCPRWAIAVRFWTYLAREFSSA